MRGWAAQQQPNQQQQRLQCASARQQRQQQQLVATSARRPPHAQRGAVRAAAAAAAPGGGTGDAAAAGSTAEKQPPGVISTQQGAFVWASCVSAKPTVASAVEDAAAGIMQHHASQQPAGGFQPDLALVFASCNYGSQLSDVVAAVRRAAPSVRAVFGCSAYGVVGSSSSTSGGVCEVEGEPGISLTLAALPGCELSLTHTLRSSLPSEDAPPDAWADLVGVSPVQPLTPSPPPSNTGSMDDAGGEQQVQVQVQVQDTQQQGEQRDKQQDEQPPSAGDDSSIEAASRAALLQRSARLRAAARVAAAADGDAGEQQAAAGTGDAAAAAPPSSAVSFLVLCDPRFQQIRQLLAGLDFAFPGSNKVGAVLSQGQQNKRRQMFVWSADSAVQPGTPGWRQRQRQRRTQQQQQAANDAAVSAAGTGGSTTPVQEAPEVRPQQPPPAFSSSTGKKKGLFASLFDSLLGGLTDDEQQRGSSSSGAAAVVGGDSSDDDDDDQAAAAVNESGVFVYGASVLAIKGPLVVEPLTCQGYRTVSDKVWVVGDTSRDGDLIGSLIDPDEGRDSSSNRGRRARADSDDESDGERSGRSSSSGSGGSEVVPLLAVYELLEALGPGVDVSDLGGMLAVAIAPDSWSPASSLRHDEFTVAAISEVWSQQGYIRIDGQARPGYRLKLVLRDEQGMRADLRERLLGLKRAELAGVLAGRRSPPTLGALLFSDIGRGSQVFDSPHYESSVVSTFLPVPLAGAFGAAQVSTVNGVGGVYEMSSVVGVLRLLQPPAEQQESASSGQEPADAQAQQEQQ